VTGVQTCALPICFHCQRQIICSCSLKPLMGQFLSYLWPQNEVQMPEIRKESVEEKIKQDKEERERREKHDNE